MPYDPNLVNRIQGATRGRDVAKVEEIWVELQASGLGELKFFRNVAREVIASPLETVGS